MMKKLWKGLAGTALCAGLCLGMAGAAQAAQGIPVLVDGILQTRLFAQPYAENEVTMVGLRDMGSMYDATYGWDEATGSVWMRVGTKRIALTVGSDTAIVNYNEVKMPAAVEIRGEYTMLPLRFVSETLGMKVNWDGPNGAIWIDTKAEDYGVLSLPALEVENPVTYTFEAALAKINAADSSIQDILDNLEILEENKEDLDDAVKEVYSSTSKEKNNWSMSVIEMLRQQRSMNNQIRSMHMNMSQIKDGNEYNLRSALTAIEETRLDMYLLEESIVQDEIGLANAELKLSLGLETEANVKAARLGLDQSKSNLQNLRLTQNANQLNLNNQLSVASWQNAVVAGFDVTQPTPYGEDVDAFIAAQQAVAPSVMAKFLAYDNAYFTLYSYEELLYEREQDYREKEKEPTQNERKMENEVQSKTRELDDARAALDKKIRGAYNSLQQIKERAATQQIDLEKAIDTYKRTVNSYFAGLATANQVDQARLGILNVEVSIYKTRISYATATYGYQKP